jgi:hypothetical protein
MKNIRNKISAILGFVLIVSCSNNSPKSVAESFLKAMNKMDFEEAKKYGTDDTGKMLDMLSGFTKMMPDSAKKETKSEIVSEKIDGDKATVTYKDDGKSEEQVLNLVKIDNKWKVAMSKDNMNGNANSMDAGATSTDSATDATTTDTSANQ